MTATYTQQYRPVSDEETATNDGLSIRAVRDLEEGINNYMRYQGACKVIAQPPMPHWPSQDKATITENLVVPPFPPFHVSDAHNSLSVSLGCYQTVTAGGGTSVVFRVYATGGDVYHGSSTVIDTNLLTSTYTSISLTCDTAVGVANNTILHDNLAIPKAIQQSQIDWVYIILTAQNGAGGGEEAAVSSFDITPEFA